MQILQLQGLILVTILIIYILTSHVIQKRKIRFLHESVVAIIMGILTSLILKYGVKEQVHFDADLFFNMILPPIIFAAGYSLHRSNFFDNIKIISYHGIVCTIFTFLILSTFAFLLNESNIMNVKLGEDEILLFTATLCATDTVAALTLVKEQYFPVLNSILFGEGIFNDAVSILLFRSVKNYLTETSFHELSITIALTLCFDFFYLFTLSVLFGVIFGASCSLLIKYSDLSKFPIKETGLILLFGYASYLFAELFHLSGIISLFVCGLLQSVYTYPNLSQQAQQATHISFETISYLAEAFVFAYLGITTLDLPASSIPYLFSFLMILVLALARFLTIFMAPCLAHIFKKQFPLKIRELQVIWYSGLIRGAIAFALSAQIVTPNAQVIQGSVLFIVLITTCVGSVLLESFSEYVGLKVHDEELFLQFQQFMLETKDTDEASVYHQIGYPKKPAKESLQSIKTNSSTPDVQYKKSNWKKFEEKMIRPFFNKETKKNDVQEEQKVEISLNTYSEFV